MTSPELKKLLTRYVDLLTRYERQGNRKAIKQVNQSIAYIKNELKRRG